jgi:hypothetical protein
MKNRRGISLAFSAFVLAACTTVVPNTKPAPDVPSAGRFPHERLGLVLAKVVSPEGLVDYAQLDMSRDLLEEYLAELARVSPDSHRHLFPTEEDALAYWINAFNACALRDALHWQRPAHLTPISHRFDSETEFLLGGRKMSLNAMRGRMVNGFSDPRVHFVLVAARRGGPPLSAEPFGAADLEKRLEAAARAFVGSERNVEVLPSGRETRVSDIFLRYRADLEGEVSAQVTGDARLVAALNRWREPARQILATRVVPIPFDDRLNDVANK